LIDKVQHASPINQKRKRLFINILLETVTSYRECLNRDDMVHNKEGYCEVRVSTAGIASVSIVDNTSRICTFPFDNIESLLRVNVVFQNYSLM
jgi:hypothetical protein